MRRLQASAIGVVGYLLGFIWSNTGSTTHPKKKSRFSSPPCQVTENPELTHVVRQFIQANRAVNEVEKDF
ncbi:MULTISPECIES: hypothetical protein [unclassified Microcoleus]|uniref:hypothetical protein n=1 Tax=unclassified Microcoleus TaxID=2642155 RepID=UPI002FD0D101